MTDLIREARRNAKNWADKPESAAMWNRFADEIEHLTLKVEAYKRYRAENRKLQAVIDELEGVIDRALDEGYIGNKWLREALATEQGESDE